MLQGSIISSNSPVKSAPMTIVLTGFNKLGSHVVIPIVEIGDTLSSSTRNNVANTATQLARIYEQSPIKLSKTTTHMFDNETLIKVDNPEVQRILQDLFDKEMLQEDGEMKNKTDDDIAPCDHIPDDHPDLKESMVLTMNDSDALAPRFYPTCLAIKHSRSKECFIKHYFTKAF
jgi:hypothetical protein